MNDVVIADSDPRYPVQLLHPDGPPALYCRGNVDLLHEPLVAIVGSRDVAAEAEVFAERLAMAAARLGVGVVSGGARGIDTAAHRGAMRVGKPTIVVLGTPLDGQASYATRQVLASLDWRRDLVISEQAPGTPTRAWHFLARNRIIARLAHSVVVVRARAASGALSTASVALEAKRPLYAVPGAPWDERSLGVNSLFSQGARLVRHEADLTEGLCAQFRLVPEKALLPVGDPRLEFLVEPRSVDELMDAWQLSAEQVLRVLVQYELGGCIRRLPDGRFVC